MAKTIRRPSPRERGEHHPTRKVRKVTHRRDRQSARQMLREHAR